MSESFPLPTEPEGVIPSLVERFNSGKVEVMMAVRRQIIWDRRGRD